MCGRFINTNKVNKLKQIFDIRTNDISIKENISYNIAPSNLVNVIINSENSQIDNIYWGIRLNNQSDSKYQMLINSRLETITTKILFKESFYKKRCVVPANGWFEWSIKNEIKNPYFIEISVQETIYFAGIWKYSNINSKTEKTFSIITKSANNILQNIHNRMPVILSINEAMDYMEDKTGNYLTNKFSSEIEKDLNYYPVSKFVNSTVNNSKICIKPININTGA